MILHGDTDSTYLVLPKIRSRVVGHFYLSYLPPTNNTPKKKLNSPILYICQTLKDVVASEAEV